MSSDCTLVEINGEWELTFGPSERKDLERMVVAGAWDDLADFQLLSHMQRDHFRDQAARDGWFALKECARKYQRLDPLLVRETMAASGTQQSFQALMETMSACGIITHNQIQAGCELIQEMEFRRKAWVAAQEVLQNVQRRALTMDDLRIKAITSLTEAFVGSDRKMARSAESILLEYGDYLAVREGLQSEAEDNPENPAAVALLGIESPFINLNTLTSGGPTTKQVVYLGGWPGMGKSALAADLGLAMAAWLNCPGACYYWTGEMSGEQMARRIAAKKCGVKIGMVKSTHAYQAANQAPSFYIDDDSDMTIDLLESRLTMWKLMHPGFRVCILDYVLLLADNDHKELSKLSRRLVKLSKNLDILIIGLQQLKTELQHRGDKRPLMGDLAECGQFVRDAGGIWMIHRPGAWDEAYKQQEEAYLYVRKNRDGPLGFVSLRWDAKTATYTQYIPVAKPAKAERELREPEDPNQGVLAISMPNEENITWDDVPL